jgi:hypothetical protein
VTRRVAGTSIPRESGAGTQIAEWQIWVSIGVLSAAAAVGTFAGMALNDFRLRNPRQTASAPLAGLADPAAPVAASSEAFTVQVGVFRDYANAERLTAALERQHGHVNMVRQEGGLYSVSLGPVPGEARANGIAHQIASEWNLSPKVWRSRSAETSD